MRWSLVPALWILIGASVGCSAEGEVRDYTNNNAGTPEADMSAEADADPGEALELSGISPDRGPVDGDTIVTLTGRGFNAGMTVEFGQQPVSTIEVSSETTATVKAPEALQAGAVDVTVRLPQGARATLEDAYTYEEEVAEPGCKLGVLSPSQIVAQVPSTPITTVVFVADETPGAGRAGGVDVELGWGAGEDYESFEFSAMNYRADVDGERGAGSDDEYAAALTIDSPGAYRYVSRFKVDGGEWTYCDLDGSRDGVSSSALGSFSVVEAAERMVSFCQLADQGVVTSEAGTPTPDIFAQVFAPGLTPGPGQGALIEGELGFGEGDDYERFAYVPMAYSADRDGEEVGDLARDQYSASLSVPTAGTYKYVARFKTAGAPWFYCDLDGNGFDQSFETDQLGQLDISPAQSTIISACRTETDAASALVDAVSGQIFGSVTVPGLTGADGAADGLRAELVWGAASSAPDTWTEQVDATYDADGDGDSELFVATLSSAAAGDFGYAYRFSVDDGATWSWCDTDGSDGTAPGFEEQKVGAFTVTEQAVTRIVACDTETFAATAAVASASSPISGKVTIPGVTDGAGEGAGVLAELVWGDVNADPLTWANVVPAVYDSDRDQQPGDLASDRYVTAITPQMAGSYGYYYRFSVDAGQTWSGCDTDGSDGTTAGFEAAKFGALTAVAPDAPDECYLQFPAISDAVVVGDSASLFVRVKELGVTDVSDASPDILAEVWVGPVGADVQADPGAFTKLPASFSAMPTGIDADTDEYFVNFTPATAGAYAFYARVSVDGGASYAFCDLDGGALELDKPGVVVAHDTAPDMIDYCHVFQTGVTKSLADPSDPVYTVEVYEPGVTPGNAGASSAQIEAQIGYGAPGVNPAVPMGFVWRAAPFSQVGPSNPNNYEYQAIPYDTAPAVGDYHVVYRVRLTGQSDAHWRYCDNLDSTIDYIPAFAPTLEVVP